MAWDEEELEKQIKDGGFGDGLPVERYERGFYLLRRLVAGEINFNASSPIDYWND